jgi:hypothetical protein
MKKNILALTLTMSLLAITNAQAFEMGEGGMRLPSDKRPGAEHHKYQGSSLHEAAAAAHSQAAKHHKKAASMYRTSKDSKAVEHATAAITASDDAFAATEATKEILPK